MVWEELTPQRKREVLGFLEFNRHGEEWDNYNSFYSGEDNLIDIEEDEQEEGFNSEY